MTDQPIICPICRNRRPTYEEILAYKDAPEGSETKTVVDAYNTCCNPMCKGEWGTNCWHCHHPKFLETCADERIFEIAFDTRPTGEYWERLLQVSTERIIAAYDACVGYGPYGNLTQGEWETRRQALQIFRMEAIKARDARLAAEPLKLKAKTILECQLAVCKYCRASAETGETTMHTCVAAPLKEMLNDIALKLYGDAEQNLVSDLVEQQSLPEEDFRPGDPSGLRGRSLGPWK